MTTTTAPAGEDGTTTPGTGDVVRWATRARCRPRDGTVGRDDDAWALVIGREEEGRYLAATWREGPVPLYRWRLRWGDGRIEEIVCAADNCEPL